jgi:hypothetical protein
MIERLYDQRVRAKEKANMGYGGRTTAHGSIANIASIIIITKLSRRTKHCGERNIACTRAGSDKEIEGMTASSVIDGSHGAVSRWGFFGRSDEPKRQPYLPDFCNAFG